MCHARWRCAACVSSTCMMRSLSCMCLEGAMLVWYQYTNVGAHYRSTLTAYIIPLIRATPGLVAFVYPRNLPYDDGSHYLTLLRYGSLNCHVIFTQSMTLTWDLFGSRQVQGSLQRKATKQLNCPFSAGHASWSKQPGQRC